jgi:methylated-DNA-protein-cysteine methyltransferase-like protein
MDAYKRIYAAVRQIPKGKVATYGQIARLAGLPGNARQVGYALSALPGDKIPWHRVINAKGEVSPRAIPQYEDRQRLQLEKECIRFDTHGRISLRRYQWKRTGG